MSDLRTRNVQLLTLPHVSDIDEQHELAPLRTLLQQLEDYTASAAFLAPSARNDLQACAELNRDAYYESTSSREALGKTPNRGDVEKIYDATRKAKDNGVVAVEWNERVHGPVLHMALEHSIHCKTLDVHNMYVSFLPKRPIEPRTNLQ